MHESSMSIHELSAPLSPFATVSTAPLAILSDMDGVLVDSEELHWMSAVTVLRRFVPDAAPPQERGWGDRDLWERWRLHYDLPSSRDDLIRARLELAAELLQSEPPPLLPGAAALPRVCAEYGIPFVVVSASARAHIEASLHPHGLTQQLSLIVSGLDDCKENKPSPDCYRLAAELIGVPIERCWILEDSSPGLKAGLAAGAGEVFWLPAEPADAALWALRARATQLASLTELPSRITEAQIDNLRPRALSPSP